MFADYHKGNEMVIRVLIEEASDLTLVGTKTVLEEDHRLSVIATARGLDELLEKAVQTQPDVILFGDGFYSEDLLTSIERIQAATPAARLIMSGDVTDGRFLQDLFDVGLRGYLCRGDELCSLLTHAIMVVMRDRFYLSPTANSEYLVAMQSPQKHWHLDAEARRILKRLVQGMHVTEIARQENLSLRRIYRVRQKLRERFDATTNEQLVLRAVADGFVGQGE